MCCDSTQQKSICSCQNGLMNSSAFWSKKKKITILEEHLKCLQRQIAETNEAIEELKK